MMIMNLSAKRISKMIEQVTWSRNQIWLLMIWMIVIHMVSFNLTMSILEPVK